jgi:hypothetical protein
MISKRTHLSRPHVWSLDPGLDTSSGFEARYAKFLESGDLAELPVLDGRRVTVFYVTSLRREEMLAMSDVAMADVRILTKAGMNGIVGLAFLRTMDAVVSRGLQRVENWLDEAGRQIGLKFDDDGRGGKILAKETLEDLHYPGLINELGLRILEISMPGPTHGQGS